MEKSGFSEKGWLSRREFLYAMGAGAAAVSMGSQVVGGADAFSARTDAKKGVAKVLGAFVYPPTESLRKQGYYSWPGSTFDAERRQKQYLGEIRRIESELGMRITMSEKALDEEADVTRFISEVNRSQPDGLLLVPFKKGHWKHVIRIVDETAVPTVVLATLGVLLINHIAQLHRRSGVYMISSLDNFDAVRYGMRMVRTGFRMKNSLLINIIGAEVTESTVPGLGTRVRTVPHERFYEQFRFTEPTAEVRALAEGYLRNAKEVVEPSKGDILEAAKCYFALKRIIKAEQADALMMRCLPGLKRPHKHVPPCMAFMSLRDEGFPAGCQSDLSATLTLMLVQELFEKPGFQQNASAETEKNHYFGAHCTSASKMNGAGTVSEPYILRNHAEAGWGCVPRVLFSAGQEVTMAQYLLSDAPEMLVYSGEIVGCPPIPPTGGCRTNIEMTINEVEDVCDVKGMHQIIFYGNFAKQLRAFCQLYGIKAVT